MKEIPLTQGKVALVDDDDYERVMQFKWYVFKTGNRWYAGSNSPGLPMRILLHRFILGLKPNDPEVDHVNGNGLDCRKSNLRFATRSQNMANRLKPNGSYSSIYKGVTWNKTKQKWQAQIRADYKHISLGYFPLEQEENAARAYDKGAIKYFGEFAKTNFPVEDYG